MIKKGKCAMIMDTVEQLIRIPVNHVTLEGALFVPQEAQGIVLFAHGSGSSRHSPRNNFVARMLHQGNLGTLLIDLLSVKEDADYEMRFDIDLLTDRLLAVTRWLHEEKRTQGLPIGYFGASTGAAAALKAAAVDSTVRAVVSRGGRPDLAIPELTRVKAPTLLLVGGNDDVVITLNQQAYEYLTMEKQLTIIPGATHLFEEPGTLEEVARQAASWFNRFLPQEGIEG
jgi:dienelactone hydrolase